MSHQFSEQEQPGYLDGDRALIPDLLGLGWEDGLVGIEPKIPFYGTETTSKRNLHLIVGKYRVVI